MDNPNCSTEHKKYQHLSSEERHIIEVRFNEDKWTIYAIAKSLGRPYNTIKNEINRGTVYLYNGKIARYKADKGEEAYREHRKNSCRNYRCLETAKFLRYVEDQFFDEGWSLDAAVGHAKANGLFSSKEMVCTKTLYNYVDSGLLKIKNIDLPEKLSRKTKTKKDRESKRKLGNSIEQRPDIVDTREEFGHWEIDSVIGRKAEGESQVMTIVERKLRESIWIKVRDHSAEAID
jgi:IS30 family transposase